MFRIAVVAMLAATALAGCAETTEVPLPVDGKAHGIPEDAGYLGIQGIWLGSETRTGFDGDDVGRDLTYNTWPGTIVAFGAPWDRLAANEVGDRAQVWLAGWIVTEEQPVFGEMECIHVQDGQGSDRGVCSDVTPRMTACAAPHRPPQWDPRDGIAPPAPLEALFITYDRGHAGLIDCDVGTWHWSVTRVVGRMDDGTWQPGKTTRTVYDHDGDVMATAALDAWWGPGHEVKRLNDVLSFEPALGDDGSTTLRADLVEVPDRPASLHVRLDPETTGVFSPSAWRLVGPGGTQVAMELRGADQSLEALAPDASPGMWHVEVTPGQPLPAARIMLLDIMS